VTSQDVSEALATRGFSVEKKQIILEEPIKPLECTTCRCVCTQTCWRS